MSEITGESAGDGDGREPSAKARRWTTSEIEQISIQVAGFLRRDQPGMAVYASHRLGKSHCAEYFRLTVVRRHRP